MDESLSFCCPIFINHGGWLADIITDEELGGVLPADDTKKAYRIIDRFINNHSQISIAKKNSLKLSRGIFSKDIQTKKICHLVENIHIKEAIN